MAQKSFFDQLGNEIILAQSPSRIISLVPSQTELLYDLGLNQEVIGITKFCVHPKQWQKEKKIIGGTKNFRMDTIDEIKPDLIIGNKEENYKEGIEALQEKYPVWMSDITTLADALTMISNVGELTNRQRGAKNIIESIKTSFGLIEKRSPERVLYLIWRNPWMGAGSQTFIHTILKEIGFLNCLGHRSRYPELSSQEIIDLSPDVVFLSSEPYPFVEKHIAELKLLIPASKILLVDGEMFSWYGSRLIKAPAYFNSLDI